VGGRVVGVQGKGTAKFGLRFFPFPLIRQPEGERGVGFGQGVIEFDGLARCFVGQEFGLLRRDGNVAGATL